MDFLKAYMDYTEDTESPRIYHRWCALAGASALLGRSIYLRHNHSRIYSNLYCMLIGEPAARKSTAIKLSRKLLLDSGYNKFAADKSSKEKFLFDLATDNADDIPIPGAPSKLSSKKSYDNVTYNNLWGTESSNGGGDPKEVFISADEFNDFVGTGNHEFFTTLGSLWDWDSPQPFTQRFKSGSISIYQPTVTMLGGNTQENFSRAFPPELIGQGFLSRLLLVYGARTERKIAFPRSPTIGETTRIISDLHAIRRYCLSSTEIILRSDARALLERIYTDWQDLDDVRFARYSNRRFTHLLKMCVLITGIKLQLEVTPEIVIEANTYLSAAEAQMSEALGEFGRKKASPVANGIMQLLDRATAPVGISEIYKQFRTEVEGPKDIGDILEGLRQAQRAQYISSKGWLPWKAVKKKVEYVNWDYLTEEERAAV